MRAHQLHHAALVVLALTLGWLPVVDAYEPAVGVWYYCDSTMSYYPHVLVCKEGWRTMPAIPPNAPPPTFR